MREILFRGKTEISERWVVGDLVQWIGDDMCICEEYNSTEKKQYAVIPETVGQYTGLMDKSGKKIFEGDIVKITDRNICFDTMAVIEFGNPNGLYTWGWQLKPLENKPFAIEILHWVDMEDSGAFIEVIGNVMDNPELLKGDVKHDR